MKINKRIEFTFLLYCSDYIIYILPYNNVIYYIQGAEDELKHAVGLVRPVSVAFEVVDGFRLYKDGVFSSDICGSSPMVSFFSTSS